jgi:PAS domain S-box-containing protein
MSENFTHIEAPFFLLDSHGNILNANDVAIHYYGYTHDELLSMNATELRIPSERPKFPDIMKECFNRSCVTQTVHQRKDGSTFDAEVVYNGITIGTGNVVACVIRDISERKRTEEALWESREHLNKAQEIAHLGSWMWDLKTGKQVWSDERYRIFGLVPGEIEPTYDLYMGFIHPDDRQSVGNALSNALKDKKPFNAEYRIIRKDGSTRYMHSEGTVICNKNGEPVRMFAIGQDITERKNAEDALRENEERFRALADNIPNLAWMANADGWIFWYNKQWYDYTGTTLREMQGWGWKKVHHPDYVKEVTAEWMASIKSEEPFDSIFPLRGKDGNYRWFLTRVTPIRNDQGKIQFWFGTNTDITERIDAEEALKDAKAQTELYVDLMGHDINNMNQSAMGYLELALEKLETEKKLLLDDQFLIERPMQSLVNSSMLIDKVRTLQKLMTEGVKTKPIDLNKIFKELESMTFDMHNRDVRINIQPVSGIMVEANELLKDVFVNLITNSIKHSNEEKPLTINVNVEPANDNGKNYYRCAVEDNGPGIPDELKPKLFHRFQRGSTKAHGKGLGLYLIRTLVEGYGGKVWVEDRVPGDYKKGSRFVVVLPAA